MIIAQEKRKQNIIEYILYMWQVEDLIRASQLDLNLIDMNIVAKYDQPNEVKKEIRNWYENHIEMMIGEGKQTNGHLVYLENIVNGLQELHIKLLHSEFENEYQKLYQNALPAIRELKFRSKNKQIKDMTASLNGLYGYLMLKLQGKKISEGTVDGIKNLSNMLALLSDRYKKFKTGKEEI
jgi:hypothetical protein